MNDELLEYFKGDDLAAQVWLDKYALQGEKTPDDMHKRLAKEFARIELKNKSEESSKNIEFLSEYGVNRDFKEEHIEGIIYNLFKDFKYIVPQGSIMSQLGSSSIGSLSNCFVVGQPEDSYGGIFQKDEEIAQLEKRRGGVGIDISTLRPNMAPTSNAAKTSTGAVSFMHRFSNTTREVAQNGRRGALMISMDVRHPDIMDFIKMKRDLSQVTGANISIKLNDEFMKAVEADEDYILRFPTTVNIDNAYWATTEEASKQPRWDSFKYNTSYSVYDGDTGNSVYIKKIKAKEYWDEIIKSAHSVAEPGLMYWDKMVNYSPDGVYPQFKQVTTNPCSEIGMQPYDACRLIAVNLYNFVEKPFTKEAQFNLDDFYEINYEAMRLSDNLIDLDIEHIDRIIAKIEMDPEPMMLKFTEMALWKKIRLTALSSRRTGLGFTALGDVLAALGLKYGSEEANKIIDSIMYTKMESELDCTIDLAILRGTFEGWDNKLEYPNEGGSYEDKGGNDFYNFILSEFPKQAFRMMTFGRRNVSWSTVNGGLV